MSKTNISSDMPTHVFHALRGIPENTYDEILLENPQRIANGAFGIVFRCKLYARPADQRTVLSGIPHGSESLKDENQDILNKDKFREECIPPENVAVKKVLQDERYKNRELQILLMVDHPNIISLRYYFHLREQKGYHLCFVFNYFPLTLMHYYRLANQNGQAGVQPKVVRAIMLQIAQAIKYIHSLGICHRDIKPQNVLYDPSNGLVQISDFGSAKQLVAGQKSVSYICSRHYRAPELILGQSNYSCSIDVWSVGCVMAELILGKPIFPGDSNPGQLGEIMRIIGPPTLKDVCDMNPEWKSPCVTTIHPITVSGLVKQSKWKPAVSLLKRIFVYSPLKRITGTKMVSHYYFHQASVVDAIQSFNAKD